MPHGQGRPGMKLHGVLPTQEQEYKEGCYFCMETYSLLDENLGFLLFCFAYCILTKDFFLVLFELFFSFFREIKKRIKQPALLLD